MSSRQRIQATVPVPSANLFSLQSAVMALKELAEVLAGQRGRQNDWAVTFGDVPALIAGSKGDGTWNPFAYANGWTDYASPYSPCGYRKLSSGLVILRGLVQNGTAAAICTLPVGYRPAIQLLTAAQTSPNALCRIDVSPGGVVSHTGGSTGWISLCNIAFLAEN